MPVPVWGTATPGEKVAVTLEGQTKLTATTDATGKWIVRLTKLKPGGPFEMTIAGKAPGEAPIVVKDVLVGEVWLGSGQSNMQFYVSNKGSRPRALRPARRRQGRSPRPTTHKSACSPSRWRPPSTPKRTRGRRVARVCTPQNVPNFSAVGYLFARDPQPGAQAPRRHRALGLSGASTAEAWIPRDTLLADPLLKPMVDKLDAREAYFKSHPTAPATAAPPAPTTINSRPGRPGPLRAIPHATSTSPRSSSTR